VTFSSRRSQITRPNRIVPEWRVLVGIHCSIPVLAGIEEHTARFVLLGLFPATTGEDVFYSEMARRDCRAESLTTALAVVDRGELDAQEGRDLPFRNRRGGGAR
jgi:hypothetical protein